MTSIVPKQASLLAQVAQIADAHATTSVFADYRSRKAANTLDRQDDDLAAFCDYLSRVKIKLDAQRLASEPAAWVGITWGLVKGFVGYLLQLGYTVGSINARLSTIKVYCRLANQAGALSGEELTRITNVRGYSRTEGTRVNAGRARSRVSAEKEAANVLTIDQVQTLRRRPSTPHGRRDRVLIGLMLDLGLRVGEVIALQVADVDLERARITFFRPKVQKSQTHELPPDLVADLRAYIGALDPCPGALIRRLLRGGGLAPDRATRYSVFQRLREIGEEIGVPTLSPHDLRHTWATNKARAGVSLERLRDAGGWSSVTTPATRYIEPAKIANQGVLGVGR